MTGKFSHPLDEYLWGLTLDGGADEEASLDDANGWWGLMRFSREDKLNWLHKVRADDVMDQDDGRILFGKAGAILHEDSQGFVDVELFQKEKDLKEEWAGIEAFVDAYYEGEGDEE